MAAAANREYLVDLGGHPPYHPPPDGFKMPSVTGQQQQTGGNLAPFNSDSGSDADSSMTTSSSNTATAATSSSTAASSSVAATVAMNSGDRNRNFTTLEDNANYSSSNASNSPKIPFSTFSPAGNNNLNSDNRHNGNLRNKPPHPVQIGNGILKKPPRAPPTSAASTPKRVAQQRSSEARNEAVNESAKKCPTYFTH
jgi:uncharacterized membrane protein